MGSLRFWGPGLLSTSPAFSMSSASHSAGSSGRLAQKTGAGPTFQWAGKVDAICRSRSNRAKRPRAGCILRSLSLHLTSIPCSIKQCYPHKVQTDFMDPNFYQHLNTYTVTSFNIVGFLLRLMAPCNHNQCFIRATKRNDTSKFLDGLSTSLFLQQNSPHPSHFFLPLYAASTISQVCRPAIHELTLPQYIYSLY